MALRYNLRGWGLLGFYTSCSQDQAHCLACNRYLVSVYCFDDKSQKKLLRAIRYFVLEMKVSSALISGMRECGLGPGCWGFPGALGGQRRVSHTLL